jgi:hypothetical protein
MLLLLLLLLHAPISTCRRLILPAGHCLLLLLLLFVRESPVFLVVFNVDPCCPRMQPCQASRLSCNEQHAMPARCPVLPHLECLPLCLALCVFTDHNFQLQRLQLQGALDIPLRGQQEAA